jgi:16S rRNA processing protein RimM
VYKRQAQALGIVRELMSTGPQTVLVIEAMQDDKPVERMIPFVSAYVDDVSLTDKTIRVDWQLDY